MNSIAANNGFAAAGNASPAPNAAGQTAGQATGQAARQAGVERTRWYFGGSAPKEQISDIVLKCKAIANGFALHEDNANQEPFILQHYLEGTVRNLIHRDQTLRYNQVSLVDKALVQLSREDKLAALILFVAEYNGLAESVGPAEKRQEAARMLKNLGVIREKAAAAGASAPAVPDNASGQVNIPIHNGPPSGAPVQNGHESAGPVQSNNSISAAQNIAGAVTQGEASQVGFSGQNTPAVMGSIEYGQHTVMTQNQVMMQTISQPAVQGYTPRNLGGYAHSSTGNMAVVANPGNSNNRADTGYELANGPGHSLLPQNGSGYPDPSEHQLAYPSAGQDLSLEEYWAPGMDPSL